MQYKFNKFSITFILLAIAIFFVKGHSLLIDLIFYIAISAILIGGLLMVVKSGNRYGYNSVNNFQNHSENEVLYSKASFNLARPIFVVGIMLFLTSLILSYILYY